MHISKIAYQICWVVSEKRFLKYQPIKTYYWPWQPFWIFYQHQKPKFCKVPPTEHFLPSLVTMGNVGLEKKCKTFKQQRTKVMTIVHMTLQVRWANKRFSIILFSCQLCTSRVNYLPSRKQSDTELIRRLTCNSVLNNLWQWGVLLPTFLADIFG